MIYGRAAPDAGWDGLRRTISAWRLSRVDRTLLGQALRRKLQYKVELQVNEEGLEGSGVSGEAGEVRRGGWKGLAERRRG